MKTKQKTKKHTLKRLSLSPLKPEEALKAFMEVDPKAVHARLLMEKRKYKQ
jgi:hypothetical protein